MTNTASNDDEIQRATAFLSEVFDSSPSNPSAFKSVIGTSKAEIESLVELYFLRRTQQRVFEELVRARKARDKRKASPNANPEVSQLLEAKVAALQELEASFPKEYPVRLRHLLRRGPEPKHNLLYPSDEAKEAVRPPNAQEWSEFAQSVERLITKRDEIAAEEPSLFPLKPQPLSLSMFRVPPPLALSDERMEIDSHPVSRDSSPFSTLLDDISGLHSSFSHIHEVRIDEQRPALEDLLDDFDAKLKEEESRWPHEPVELEKLRQQYPKWKEEADARVEQLRRIVEELEEGNKKHRGSNFALRVEAYKLKNDVDEAKELYNSLLQPPTEPTPAFTHPQFSELVTPIKGDISIIARKHAQAMLSSFYKDLKSMVTEVSALMYHDLQNTLEPIVEHTDRTLREIYREP